MDQPVNPPPNFSNPTLELKIRNPCGRSNGGRRLPEFRNFGAAEEDQKRKFSFLLKNIF